MRNTYKFALVFLGLLIFGVINFSTIHASGIDTRIKLVNFSDYPLSGYYIVIKILGFPSNTPLDFTDSNGLTLGFTNLFEGDSFNYSIYNISDYQNTLPVSIGGPVSVSSGWSSPYTLKVDLAPISVTPPVIPPASAEDTLTEFSTRPGGSDDCAPLTKIGEIFYGTDSREEDKAFHFCYSHEIFNPNSGGGYVKDINFVEGLDCASGWRDTGSFNALEGVRTLCVESASGLTIGNQRVIDIQIKANENCPSDFTPRAVQLNATTSLSLCLKFVSVSSVVCPTPPTQSCHVGNCEGTQVCSNGGWGRCDLIDPNCKVCSRGQSEVCSLGGACNCARYCNDQGNWSLCMKDASSNCNPNVNPNLIPVYRKYLTGVEDGFLTSDSSEGGMCGLEPLFCAFKTSDNGSNLTILYRLFNRKSDSTSDHLYTISRDEFLTLNATGWDWEGGESGIAKLSNVRGEGMIPIYRYSREGQNFDHDVGLNESVPSGYISQGIMGYAYSSESCEFVVPKSCGGESGGVADPIAGAVGGCVAGGLIGSIVPGLSLITAPIGCIVGGAAGAWAGQNIQGIGDLVSNVGKFIGDVVNGVTNAIKGVGDAIGGIGGNMFGGFGKIFDGIKQIIWPFG